MQLCQVVTKLFLCGTSPPSDKTIDGSIHKSGGRPGSHGSDHLTGTIDTIATLKEGTALNRGPIDAQPWPGMSLRLAVPMIRAEYGRASMDIADNSFNQCTSADAPLAEADPSGTHKPGSVFSTALTIRAMFRRPSPSAGGGLAPVAERNASGTSTVPCLTKRSRPAAECHDDFWTLMTTTELQDRPIDASAHDVAVLPEGPDITALVTPDATAGGAASSPVISLSTQRSEGTISSPLPPGLAPPNSTVALRSITTLLSRHSSLGRAGTLSALHSTTGVQSPMRAQDGVMANPLELLHGLVALRFLSRGAYASVYTGRWKGHAVAAKLLACHDLDRSSPVLREALLGRTLQHPNVVATYLTRVARFGQGELHAAMAAPLLVAGASGAAAATRPANAGQAGRSRSAAAARSSFLLTSLPNLHLPPVALPPETEAKAGAEAARDAAAAAAGASAVTPGGAAATQREGRAGCRMPSPLQRRGQLSHCSTRVSFRAQTTHGTGAADGSPPCTPMATPRTRAFSGDCGQAAAAAGSYSPAGRVTAPNSGVLSPTAANLREVLFGLAVAPGMYVCLCIMEYCSLGSLEAMCTKDLFAPGRQAGAPPLQSERLLVQVAKDVAQGLAYLHSNGLIHGDIKPANVLLQQQQQQDDAGCSGDTAGEPCSPPRPTAAATTFGEAAGNAPRVVSGAASRLARASTSGASRRWVGGSCGGGGGSASRPAGFVAKLADWGMTQLARNDGDGSHGSGSANSAAHIGTVPYAAPERFDGKRLPASDVYSFGVLLWQMASGQRPYDGLLMGQIMVIKCCHGARLEWPAGRHEALRALFEHCTAHEPSERPTAEQVVAELTTLECSLAAMDAPAEQLQAAPGPGNCVDGSRVGGSGVPSSLPRAHGGSTSAAVAAAAPIPEHPAAAFQTLEQCPQPRPGPPRRPAAAPQPPLP